VTPHLLYWTAALVNLAVICGLALLGARCARRSEIARHRRLVKIASLLVLAFLVSYVVKLAVLGREDRSGWTLLDLWLLRVHELFVLQMVVAGSVAWWRARQLIPTRLVTLDPKDPEPEASVARVHRLAGRVAVAGALLAFVLAIGVLAGMYARALG
jgi:uncharacterized membrane protein YozB (DUF420 family)